MKTEMIDTLNKKLKDVDIKTISLIFKVGYIEGLNEGYDEGYTEGFYAGRE